VTLVDSTGLAGLGGASIKQFLTDDIEPEPRDDITPAFTRLNDFDVIVVAALLPDDAERFFTAGRIAALRTYLEKGGGLLTTETAPAALNDLLPVRLLDGGRGMNAERCRPRSAVFAGLPDRWPCFSSGRRVQQRAGTEVLVEELVEQGNPVPHIAGIELGTGRSVYWNAEWRRRNHFKQLSDWVYFADVLNRVVRYAARRPVEGSQLLARPPSVPDVLACPSAAVSLAVPTMTEEGQFSSASVVSTGDSLEVTFANGVRLSFNRETLVYAATVPGFEGSVLHSVRPPAVLCSRASAHTNWDAESAEAVEQGEAAETALEGTFRLAGWQGTAAGGVQLELNGVTESGGSLGLVWEFAPRRTIVAGRVYEGFGERVLVASGPPSVLGVVNTGRIRMGKQLAGHKAWRMACYAAPRGFLELPFRVDETATTRRWQPFGTGQPFTWLVSPAGVHCAFLDRPFVATVELAHDAGTQFVEERTRMLCGRLAPPVDTPFVWRLFSPEEPADANAWLGMYQFLRQRYCRQAGWTRPQIMPTSTHTNTCTPEERRATIRASRELGFRWHKLPLCPSAIESLVAPPVVAQYAEIAAEGLEPKPWSACAYTQGMDNPVARAHPEWLVEEEPGKPMQYFQSHPVFDLNNRDYMRHYIGVLGRAIDAGVRHFYLDMGGAQTAVVSRRGARAHTGLVGALKLYRFLNERGVTAAIEGMSPLVIDEFWFRQDRYADHTGREFAFVGMSCVANTPDHLALDYFRLGMHDAFFDVVVSSYAMGMETVPGELELVAEIGRLNRIFLQAKELVGIPFVQQTSFGTSWISPTGAALFVWNPVAEMTLEIPDDWRVRAILTPDGATETVAPTVRQLRDLPHKSCVLIGQ
jgi:hypothetical protein